jgi:putative transposase
MFTVLVMFESKAPEGSVTRNYVVPLDPNSHQLRLLSSYVGAERFCWNWLLGRVKENLEVRRCEREAGVPDDGLTSALGWSQPALARLWKAHRDEVAPWWPEVSMHAFRSACKSLAAALKNWSDSRNGKRKGRSVAFPKFRSKKHPKASVGFVEINHQLSWLSPDRHGVRLMLPACLRGGTDRARRMVGSLQWVHTRGSTRRIYRLVESQRASVQQVTFKRSGGRWWATFTLRISDPAHVPHPKRHRHKQSGDGRASVVGVDVGSRWLATVSEPVPGLTDEAGHVENPRPLAASLGKLQRLDRAISRCQPGSKNRRKLLARRARLHGRVALQRKGYLNDVTNHLSDRFDVVVCEDLHVAGMLHRKSRLGLHLSDASLATLHAQFAHKLPDRGRRHLAAPRFYPSSKTCSRCGLVKAKLARHETVFHCDDTRCGHTADRDTNAARNLRQWGAGVLATEKSSAAQLACAGTRPASGVPPGS